VDPFLCIALIVLTVIGVTLSVLIIKRVLCLNKIKRAWNGEVIYCRSPLSSVFSHDGKVDLLLKDQEKEYAVSIFTTSFRKSRYHFASDKQLEIIIEKTAAYLTNPKNSHANLTTTDRVYTIKKHRIDLDELSTHSAENRYIIVNPAPRAVSKVSGSTVEQLYDGDELVNGIRVVGLKGFLEKIS